MRISILYGIFPRSSSTLNSRHPGAILSPLGPGGLVEIFSHICRLLPRQVGVSQKMFLPTMELSYYLGGCLNFFKINLLPKGSKLPFSMQILLYLYQLLIIIIPTITGLPHPEKVGKVRKIRKKLKQSGNELEILKKLKVS